MISPLVFFVVECAAVTTLAYSDCTVASRSPFRRFSHGARFRVALELLALNPGERFLDYGAGDGHMVNLVRKVVPDVEAVGYEPFMQGEMISDLSQLRPGFDVIGCFEVLEHVSDKAAFQILENCRRLLKPEGRLVVSVPVELWLSCACKSLVRLRHDSREFNLTLPNVLRSMLGMKVERLDYGGGNYGHFGFDYRELERKFMQAGWHISRRDFSPLPFTRAILNSQVFYVLRKA